MKHPTQTEQVRMLWQLLHVEHPEHACPHYHLNVNARFEACSECASGSRPVKQEREGK